MQRPMKTPIRAVLLVTGLATLTACAPESGVGSFWREAGAQLETGTYGNATLHNQLVQTCKTNGYGYGKGGKAGSVAGDPVVVLDPSSTANRPVYRVHCDGRLDGKYASIIYNEYVRSAAETATVEEADAQ